MLEARARGWWFSRSYSVHADGRERATVEFATWRESGVIAIDHRRLTLRREGWWNPSFFLEEDGVRRATASRANAFQRSFELTSGDDSFRLAPTSIFWRPYELWSGSRSLGRIRPAGFFSRDIEIDLADELPLELSLFAFWVVVLCWRRNAGGAAGAAAAACS